MSTIGFIGLGIMGRPMATHLAAGGHTPLIYPLIYNCLRRHPA